MRLANRAPRRNRSGASPVFGDRLQQRRFAMRRAHKLAAQQCSIAQCDVGADGRHTGIG